MSNTIVRELLHRLARERRHVVSDWRTLVLLHRAAREVPESERRWRAPATITDARRLLDRMSSAGDLRPLDGVFGVYEVIVPYADVGGAGELEVLMETSACVAASHHTAMVFHDLTDDQPKMIHATVPSALGEQGAPADTTVDEWESLARAPSRFPAKILGRALRWHRVQPHRFEGIGEYRPQGWSVRVTTPERTLIDGLLEPDCCGGISAVFGGWARARDLIDVDATIQLIERLDVGVLRQRGGFVLETLGLSHPALEQWRTRSARGGSSRLCANAPYAPAFSERWSLSLNAPLEALNKESA